VEDKEQPYLKRRVLQQRKKKKRKKLRRKRKRNNYSVRRLIIDNALIKASSVLTVFTPCNGMKLIT